MSTLLQLVQHESTTFVAPIRAVVVDDHPVEALRRLLAEIGWVVELPDEVDDVVTAWESVLSVIDDLATLDEPDDLGALIELIDTIADAIDSVNGLVDSVAALIDGNDTGFVADLASDLLQYLVLRWLAEDHAVLNQTMVSLGLIRLVELPEVNVAGYTIPVRRSRTVPRIELDALPEVLGDPLGHAQTVLGYTGLVDTETAQAASLLFGTWIERLLSALGGYAGAGARLFADGPDSRSMYFSLPSLLPGRVRGRPTLGGRIELLSPDDVGQTGNRGPGLEVVGAVLAPIEMNVGTWALELSGEPPATAFFIGPTRVDLGGAPGFTLTATLSRTAGGLLIGGASSTRVELSPAVLTACLDVGATADVSVGIASHGSLIHISGGDGDSFLASILAAAIDIPFDAELEWSLSGGLRLGGSTGLEVSLPAALTIGPISVSGLTIGIGVDGEVVALAARADLGAVVGPFAAAIEGLGLEADLDLAPETAANLGFGHLTIGFVPPSRIAFEISTETVRGGGFVSIEPEIGRYTGGLSLGIVSVGIDAIVVIDTQLPGDPDGWAFFASLTASFPDIPLGFGITLNGVGGLIALNRTMDAEALAAALRTGVIDALLFPDDPVNDSAELVAQIDEYFPLLEGNTVIGPVIEIGWGSPTLITAQLGVVLSLPDGIIAVMGSVEALLPIPTAPLMTLHMDSLGVIDIGAGTFSLTASLYDSKLLETIDLSGDMAMYLQVSDQPYFLLSVGGYHPGFEPPSIVPAAMHDLRGMRAAISIASNVSVSVEAYFAVTSNSLQFGEAVYVIASVEIWPTTYTAKGWFTFDVLLVFSPFKIVASMSAGVGIYAGDKELLGVQLSLQLEGPKPWFAAGTASFKFFGLKVSFELEVGSTAAGEPKPIAHPRADVLAALASPASWSETAPLDGLAAGITYVAAAPEDDTVWVRPDHQLTVRQSIAPLNRTLEIVGQAVPAAGEELLTVTGAGFGTAGDVDWDLADDWFAPAQFEVLGKTDKLTRASFEEMTAGVTFGAPGVEVPRKALMTQVSTAYEEDTWEPDPAADFLGQSVHTGAAGTGLRHLRAPTTSPLFTVAPTAYTLVRSIDGATAADVLGDAGLPVDGVSQYAALRARNAAIAEDGSKAARLVLVPQSAALEPVP